MSALLSQLMRFSAGNGAPWHATPFSLKIKKETWSVASDGCILLAIKLAGADAKRKGYPDQLIDMLTDVAKDAVELDVEALKTWAGAVPSQLIAPGPVDHEHQGVLFEYAIDRRKLAYLLAKMTLPKVSGWVMQPGLLAFEHPQKWRAFLACLKEKPEGDEPVFQASEVPKTIFEMMELGSE